MQQLGSLGRRAVFRLFDTPAARWTLAYPRLLAFRSLISRRAFYSVRKRGGGIGAWHLIAGNLKLKVHGTEISDRRSRIYAQGGPRTITVRMKPQPGVACFLGFVSQVPSLACSVVYRAGIVGQRRVTSPLLVPPDIGVVAGVTLGGVRGQLNVAVGDRRVPRNRQRAIG